MEWQGFRYWKLVNGTMVKPVGAGGMVKMLKPTGLEIGAKLVKGRSNKRDHMASSKMVSWEGQGAVKS